MNNIIKFQQKTTLSSGGSITKKNGSNRLYVSFRYFGRKIEKSSGLKDTTDNRHDLKQWLNRIISKIDDGTFRFADAFPGASDSEKEYFAQREGWEFRPEPHQILMSDYILTWKKTIIPTFHSEGKKRDFLQALDDWIIPFLEGKTFFQFNRVEVQKLISQLKWRQGPKIGQPLSRSRIRNIMIPLRAVWFDACDEYRWNLTDPFSRIGKHIPRTAKARREVFRFDDWIEVLKHIDPYFKPIAEIMIMTGLIASEIAGLRTHDIDGDFLHIKNSIVRGQEKLDLKTPYRGRKIFITTALRERLNEISKRSDSDYLFTMKTKIPFREGSFRKNYWIPALKKAGITYKVPYTTRHSFAAWSLTIGIDPNRLVHLMGHVSKKMVYDIYGEYVEGLEKDREKIAEYFGFDFIHHKKQTP